MVTILRQRLWSPLAIAVAVAVLMAAVAVPVAAATGRWIVPAGTPLPTGSLVVGSLPVADALIVTGPTVPAGAVDYDSPVAMQSLPGDAFSYGNVSGHVDTGIAATNAPAVWSLGERGEQAVVALVDTGVANVDALQGAVAGEIDFTGTGGGDGYGHGTFMASLIVGRPDAPGVAPEAGVLSLKVGDDNGEATVGSVISALQWLHGPGATAGLRIAALAFGVDPDTDAANLLNHAADAVAKRGMLVLTSTGNTAGMVSSPATATRTVSVGATDDSWVEQTDYSGSGPDTAGVSQPDLLAPGHRIAGSLPEGAVITPESDPVDGRYHGSGTSMATALAAGVAALASSTRPDLDGDALAAALGAGNRGQVDAVDAVDAVQDLPEGKPVNAPPWVDEPGEHPGANGKAKGKGQGKSDQAESDGLRWGGLRWGGLRWGGLRWGGDAWGDESWAFGQWGGLRWGSRGWEGPETELSPSGLRWGGLRWGGLRWGGLRWGGLRWGGLRWGGLRWGMLEAPPT